MDKEKYRGTIENNIIDRNCAEVLEIMTWGYDEKKAQEIYEIAKEHHAIYELSVLETAAKISMVEKATGAYKELADAIFNVYSKVVKTVTKVWERIKLIADPYYKQEQKRLQQQRKMFYKKKKSQAKNWSKWKKRR